MNTHMNFENIIPEIKNKNQQEKEVKNKELRLAKQTIIFQDIKELYTNPTYYQILKDSIKPTSSILNINTDLVSETDYQKFVEYENYYSTFSARITLNKLCYLPDYFEETYKIFQRKELTILLEKLFIDLDIIYEDALLIRFLLQVEDKKFVHHILTAQKEKIENALKTCKICSNSSLPELTEDGEYINNRELIALSNSKTYNLKEFIKCLYPILKPDNFDFYGFNNLFFINKDKEYSYDIYKSVNIDLFRNISKKNSVLTPFFENILKKYNLVNTHLIPLLVNVENIEFILEKNNINVLALLTMNYHNIVNNKKLEKILEKIKYTKEDNTLPFPNSFFYQLKILKKTYQKTKNNKSLTTLPEYLCCKNAFFYAIKKKLNITTTNLDKVLEQLFTKLIKSDDFFNIYKINSIKELKHYNRTKNQKINTNDFIEKDLLTYSVKQYKSLCKKLHLTNKGQHTDILKLLLLFGFNLANKLTNIYSLEEITPLLNSINISNENNIKNAHEYLNYILTNNRIFNRDNVFLLKSKKNYELFKLIFQETPTLNKLKTFIESEKIELPLLAKNISTYLPSLSSKNTDEAIAKSINLYYKYQDRLTSTIPNISGKYANLTYETIDLQSPRAFILGDELNCCLAVNGKAEADLFHALLDNNGRLFAIFDNDKVIALSWLWRNNGLLCFDNIEVSKENLENEKLGTILYTIYKQAATKMYEISIKSEKEDEAITTITLGRNPIDIKIPPLINEKPVPSEILKRYLPKHGQNLYLTDSQNQQYYLLTTEKDPLNQKNTSILYKRKREEPLHFEDKNAYDLKIQIDCIRKKANLPLQNIGYITGIIASDYYIGITSNFELEAIHCGSDNRAKQELEKELHNLKEKLEQKKLQEENYQQIKKKILNTAYETFNINDFKIQKEKAESIVIDKDDYYHGTKLECLLSILDQRQITCKFRCQNRIGGILTGGSNGSYHICVTKNLEVNDSFNHYVKNGISFILNKNISTVIKMETKSIKDENNIRFCNFNDEFQVKDTIPLSKIKAISIPINSENRLKEARLISDALDAFQVDLPIIDITTKKVFSKELIHTYTKKRNLTQ